MRRSRIWVCLSRLVGGGRGCRRDAGRSGTGTRRMLLVTGGTVVTMDASGTVMADGAVAIERRDHRRRRARGRDRRRGTRRARTIDVARPDHPARPDQHAHPRADGPLSRSGRRPGADGLADEVHLPGGEGDGVARVRSRRHAARGARDDRVGHDDLRGHVLLRGRHRGGRPRGAGCEACSVSRSSSSRWRMRRRRQTRSRAPRRSSRNGKTIRSSRRRWRRTRRTRSTARRFRLRGRWPTSMACRC